MDFRKRLPSTVASSALAWASFSWMSNVGILGMKQRQRVVGKAS